MNANELIEFQEDKASEARANGFSDVWFMQTAIMLRQQQAEIEALKAKISLWDYFAANALQGLIAGCYSGNNVGFTVEGNVFAACEYADVMIKARKK